MITTELTTITKDPMNYFNEILNSNTDESALDLDNKCMITNKDLEDNYITLDCNHKFNYIPLYREILYQKTKKILDNRRLKINEIKCPYCRTVTPNLLPYYKYYGIRNVRGVNSPEQFCMKINSCEYINKDKTKCNLSGCLTKKGVFCNKHCEHTKNDEWILECFYNMEIENFKNLKVKDLKTILKRNGLKMTGKKKELINRIIIGKHRNITTWNES